MADLSKNIEPVPHELSKKRAVNKDNWKRELLRRERYSEKGLPSAPNCNHEKNTTFTCCTLKMEDVQRMHSCFYSLKNKIDQDNFILKHCRVAKCVRKRLKNQSRGPRGMSAEYYVTMETPGKEARVCKAAFLKILQVGKDRVNGILQRSFKEGANIAKENRGGNRKKAHYAERHKHVEEFIESLRASKPHYYRAKSNLPPELNIKKLWKMYEEQVTDLPHLTVKQSFFRRIYNTRYNKPSIATAMEASVDTATEKDGKCDIMHQLLCMACLGSGRTLHILQDEALNLYKLAVNAGGQLVHNMTPRVCWECEVLLKRVLQFRERVTECHHIQCIASVTRSDVTRAPRLRAHRSPAVDIPPETETDVHVKREIETDAYTMIEIDAYTIPEPEIEIDVYTKPEIERDVYSKLEASEREESKLCPACLCAGRRMICIRDKELHYYRDILKQNRMESGVTSPRLCWECCSVLHRATRFSEQAAESYRTLLPSLQHADVQDITTLLCAGVSLPPRLSRCVSACVGIPPHAHAHTPPHVQRCVVPASSSNVTCDRCQAEFVGRRQLIRHLAGNIYPHNARACVESALEHSRKQGAALASRTTDQYRCSHCSKTFIGKSRFNGHMRKHTQEKPYQCSQCAKTFKGKLNLRAHMRTHFGIKRHQCSQCSKSFLSKLHLNDHIRTHTGEKPYLCSQCSRMFTLRSNLVVHMRTHTGEKPYQCSQCSRTFKQKTHLNVHMRTHTGEKPNKKTSPTRIACPLMVDVSAAPTSVPQPWPLKQSRTKAPLGPSTEADPLCITDQPVDSSIKVEDMYEEATWLSEDIPQKNRKSVFTPPPAGIWNAAQAEIAEIEAVDNVQIEFIGFSPFTSGRWISRNPVPIDGTVARPEPQPSTKSVAIPEEQEEEFIDNSPPLSSPVVESQRSLFQHPRRNSGVSGPSTPLMQPMLISPVAPRDLFIPFLASASTKASALDVEESRMDEVSLDRDTPMIELLDTVQNCGSDVEIEDEDIVTSYRHASEFPVTFPAHTSDREVQALLNDDKEDDIFLQNMTDADKLHFDWREDPTVFQGVREVFNGSAGPTFDLDADSPLALLEKIWDSDIIALIVEQTNLYSCQLLQNPQAKRVARLNRWKPITASDIWLYFCVLILQSLDPRPKESDYWYCNLEVLEMPKFRTVMPYNQFRRIKKCIHFTDNTQLNQVDKAAKIRPILEHLNKKFSEMYSPAQEIALDESLLKWKGRLSFAQKISNKAAGVGVKTYELCESQTGYLWSFRLYTGKDDETAATEKTTVDECRHQPDSKKSAIVFDLLRPLLNKGHVLTMDNFYNSPLLSRLLKLKKTDTVGTLRINREFLPASLKNVKKNDLRVGEIVFSNTTDLTIILWRDNNLVAMISTLHPVEIGGKEKYGTYKYKPKVVLDYNDSMGGVDKKDQLLSAFPMERSRNHIWYKKVFRRLLNVSICNAWIINNTKYKGSHRVFRERLVQEILTKHQENNVCVRNVNPVGQRPLLVGGHYIIKGKSKRAKCKRCLKQGRESRTSKICDTCLIPLCAEPCFKNYHTLND